VAVDAAGNVYFADQKNKAIKEWSAATKQVSTLVSGLNTPIGVAVDGQGNVYFTDSGTASIKEWSPASGQVTVLVSSGLKYPCQVAVDGIGNVYVADLSAKAILKYSLLYLSLGASSVTEAAAAGTDSVVFQAMPAGAVLTATSNQSWLTITGTSGGAIHFSFQANTSSSSRTATITVQGQTVKVTQSADVPTAITKTAGSGESTVVNTTFATALRVQLTDASGKPVVGVPVTFTITPGTGGTSGAFAASPPMPILTNSSGVAIAPALTANNKAGTFTVSANAGALTTPFRLTITSH
jgi:sugar lactone lactonase YvrE